MKYHCPTCGYRSSQDKVTCEECDGFMRYSPPKEVFQAIEEDHSSSVILGSQKVSMGEGNTPLAELNQIISGPEVICKLESLNPTGSFKDRGASAIASVVAQADTRYEAIVVASTGNTATSTAAYAARADIPVILIVPEKTEKSKLTQAARHGATLATVDGDFSNCFTLAQQAAEQNKIINATSVYSANPYVAAANQKVAYELFLQLEKMPDWIVIPVGAGPLLGGIYDGFIELHERNYISSIPRLLAVQASGCQPIIRAIRTNSVVSEWESPIRTDINAIADPLRGYASDGERTRRAVVESGGTGIALDDRVTKRWHRRLADEEGIHVEPASAMAVGAINKCELIGSEDRCVSLLTGHGLKEQVDNKVDTQEVTNVDDIIGNLRI